MDFFEPDPLRTPIRSDPKTRRRPSAIRFLAALAGLALLIAGLAWFGPCGRPRPWSSATPPRIAITTPSTNDVPRPTTPPKPLCFTFPTPRQHLADTNTPGTFMPTVSGRVESALFGLVRTSSRGGPAFHEGIDIAPLARDRRGAPADPVFAVADGIVGYVNPIAGNSNYGLYIVLLHAEPVGEFYTLYAHLSRIEAALRPGTAVRAGDTIGLMGNTPAGILPPARGHLHFEIGLVQNSRFDQWYRAQKLTPDHGNFNGQNFIGINPQSIFCKWDNQRRFALLDHLRGAPVAFVLLIDARQPIDFFTRHPALWQGREFSPGAVVLNVAEGGVPIAGRMATPAELTTAGEQRPPLILQTSPDPLLPARRLVTRGKDDAWHLSAAGVKWLEVLLY